jgi:chorismate synthase
MMISMATRDYRGGGRSSAREKPPVVAGAARANAGRPRSMLHQQRGDLKLDKITKNSIFHK